MAKKGKRHSFPRAPLPQAGESLGDSAVNPFFDVRGRYCARAWRRRENPRAHAAVTSGSADGSGTVTERRNWPLFAPTLSPGGSSTTISKKLSSRMLPPAAEKAAPSPASLPRGAQGFYRQPHGEEGERGAAALMMRDHCLLEEL